MTPLAIALGIIGALAVGALWDVFRRALAAQVRQAEMRVEAQERGDYAALRGDLERMRRDLDGLDKAVTLGRRTR